MRVESEKNRIQKQIQDHSYVAYIRIRLGAFLNLATSQPEESWMNPYTRMRPTDVLAFVKFNPDAIGGAPQSLSSVA